MRKYKDLRVWESSLELAVFVYDVTNKYPTSEKYGLVNQMRRASVSIVSNIAEGCRGSDKELKRFLTIALGSASELESQILLSEGLGYISPLHFSKLLEDIDHILRMLNSFITNLKSR